jgi:uncharacterized protein (DUF2062 family)
MPSRFLHALHHGFLYHVIRLCRIRAASEQVARGFALGIMPHFFPTFGFGAIISAFLARACGGHGAAGLVSGALFTPFWPFFFYLNLRVGGWLRGSRVTVQSMDDVTEEKAQTLMWGRDFSVGGIVNAVLAALIAYLLLVAIYERVRPGLLAHFRRQARARRKTRRLVPA